jgi:hypothetical protein
MDYGQPFTIVSIGVVTTWFLSCISRVGSVVTMFLVGGGNEAEVVLVTPLLLTPSLIKIETKLGSSFGFVVIVLKISSSSSPSSPSTFVEILHRID